VAIPIPILDEEMCRFTAVKDAEIFCPVVDYSEAYPQAKPETLGEVSYGELKSGEIEVQGKPVPTASLSSYSKAVEIAETLKQWIKSGEFLLTESVASLPGPESGYKFRPLNERPLEP
jgi:uncharacterized protein (DUF39 family)